MSKFGESATPRIDPRQLQDFLAVVEHGSITAAAANQFTVHRASLNQLRGSKDASEDGFSIEAGPARR